MWILLNLHRSVLLQLTRSTKPGHLLVQVNQPVPLQVTGLVEASMANVAHKRLDVAVLHQMHLQAFGTRVGLTADFTHVGFQAGVQEPVSLQARRSGEPLVAELAHERLTSRVTPLMACEVRTSLESPAAVIANVSPLTRVDFLVRVQVSKAGEGLVTRITSIWFQFHVCQHMLFHHCKVNKTAAADLTDKQLPIRRVNPTVYSQVVRRCKMLMTNITAISFPRVNMAMLPQC